MRRLLLTRRALLVKIEPWRFTKHPLSRRDFFERLKCIVTGIPLGISLLATTSLSQAALIEADLYSPGDKLLTIDSLTGRSWLDLTYTVNWSVVRAQNELPSFMVASTDDVLNLWHNSGLIFDGYCTPHCDVPAQQSIVIELADKVGAIEYGTQSSGFTLDSEALYGISNAAYSYANYNMSAQITSRSTMEVRPTQTAYSYGVWLYLESPTDISEPASCLMIAAGLLSLGLGLRPRQ